MFNWHKKEKPLQGMGGLGGGVVSRLMGGVTAITYTTTIPGAPGELTPDAPLGFNGSSTTGVSHTITFDNDTTIEFKAFGAGGGSANNSGGKGGLVIATLDLTGGVEYKLFAGGRGGSGSTSRHGGGGGAASGILISSDSTKLAIAGGGGGGAGGGNGGTGGGTNGGGGASYQGYGPGGGASQSAVGTGGVIPFGANGSPGSGTNGGAGGDNNPPRTPFVGGTSGVPGQYIGGVGNDDPNDGGGGGGGGGYFGGGGGGATAGGAAGGGGSGYYNPAYAPTGNLYNGGSTEWTNEPQRSGQGDAATAGRVVLNAPA